MLQLSLIHIFLVGLFIFFIYKRTYSGVMYSASFGVTLIAPVSYTHLAVYKRQRQHKDRKVG